MENQADTVTDYGAALIAAAENGKLEVVKYLVEFKANFLPEEKHNGVPIYKALVNRGDNTDANEALINAAAKGRLGVVKYLIEQGADVHAQYDMAIMRASRGGYLEIVRHLVEKGGANLYAYHSVMSLPLAALHGYFEVVEYLVEQGADWKAKGGAALIWAAHNDHFKIVEYLLEQEGSPIEAKGGMKLLTQPQRQQLVKNFLENDAIIQEDGYPIDFKPVVKLFTPDANCAWLLTEMSLDGIAFGLCDLGLGFPEVGYVDLAELQALRRNLGLPVERDKGFVADKTLSQHTQG